MTTAITIDRTLTFEVAHNVRHIGGYRTRDGRETRPTIIRAASLHRLTDAGVDSFVAAGIRTVIDLRSEKERDELRTPNMEAHGVRHVFAPVFTSDASPTALSEDFVSFGPIYRSMLDTGATAYKTLLEVVAEADGSVLFHCAAGKDRTGIAAALLMDLAGCSDEDICEDYSRSSDLLRDAFRESQMSEEQRSRMNQLSEATRAKLLASEPEAMSETLDFLRGTFGSARGYFRALGVADDTITRARMRMLW
jgi:protein-tyrosine phosphatase